MIATQQRCSPARSITSRPGKSALPTSRPAYHSSRPNVQAPASLPDLAVLAQIIGAPGTTASTQNSVQNTLQNAPLSLQEGPEKVLIAASLVAVAVGGYLLREKAQKK